jgi:hypothetical protein
LVVLMDFGRFGAKSCGPLVVLFLRPDEVVFEALVEQGDDGGGEALPVEDGPVLLCTRFI